MYYAQFYQLSTGHVPGTIPPQFAEEHRVPIEACGTNGVLVLDGRNHIARMSTVARQACQRRGFCGYRIFKGERFSDSEPVSVYVSVTLGRC